MMTLVHFDEALMQLMQCSLVISLLLYSIFWRFDFHKVV